MLFYAAGPLVTGNGGADMVRANSLASGGNFLLRFAGCQGKDLVIKAQGTALPPAGFSAVVRWRPPDRAGAAPFVAVVLAGAALPARVPLL